MSLIAVMTLRFLIDTVAIDWQHSMYKCEMLLGSKEFYFSVHAFRENW